MGVFIQPPFWAEGVRRPVSPHARSVLVEPSAGGSPVADVISLDEAKKWARITADTENTLLDTCRRSAQHAVEQETGLALRTQTRDVFLDVVDGTLALPAQSVPLQSVTWVKSYNTAGALQTLDVSNYALDLAGARIGLSLSGVWPTDLRPFQPYVIRIVSGWPDVASMPPPLVHAVGLLTGFYANEGRNRFVAKDLRDSYEDVIAPYRLVTVA